MHSKKILLTFSVLGLILFSGCGKKVQYKAKKLTPVLKQEATVEQTQKDVTIRLQKLDQDRCKELFGANGALITSKDKIYPVQISIFNDSAQPWNLNTNTIRSHIMPSHDVVDHLTYYIAWNWKDYAVYSSFAFISGVTALLSTPVCLIIATKSTSTAAPMVAAIIGLGAVSLAAITVMQNNGILSEDVASEIDQDINDKALTSCIIEPHSVLNKLLFIQKQNLSKPFKIIVAPDRELSALDDAQEIIFDVTLE